ncbi:MAG: cytochrome P450 [Moorea sp. SIO2B7]|nr:cytochrome P450 [Moorena sp. SIO2B7]
MSGELISKAPKLQAPLIPLIGQNSLLCLRGERHRRERKLLMPPFHGERMHAYGEIICDITQQVLSQFTPGANLSARSVTQNITLEVMLKVVFGIHEEGCFHNLKKRITSLLDFFQSPLTSSLLYLPLLRRDLGSWSPWGHFNSLLKQVDQLIYAEIENRRTQYDHSRTDILTLLMSACDENGQEMSDIELRDELFTLLFAGHETTATSLSWALYWVHKQPEILKKLLSELDSLSENPEPMSIVKQPYLTAVCNETLRISPTVLLTMPRDVTEPMELTGYQLEPGTQVSGCIYLTHHREDLYPQPKEFKPERFLQRQYTAYEFLPFGGGARRCLGEALAMFEMKLVLATILSNYQLKLADNKPVKPEIRSVTIAPKGGVKMVLKGKRQHQRLSEASYSLI